MIIRSIDAIIRMLDADYIENGAIEEKIQGVCIDSRKVVEGNLYIPIHGVKNNGHAYVAQAIANGAIAVLWERKEPNPPKEVVVILCSRYNKSFARLSKGISASTKYESGRNYRQKWKDEYSTIS